MQDNERIIELIAKSLDEPLAASEQAEVQEAMQNSLAVRLAAEGLREFDALLRRTGMALPEEGFPARVIARLEAYEKRRTRAQWLLTLAILFLGSLAALAWLVLNASALVASLPGLAADMPRWLELGFTFLFAVVQYAGQGPLLIYALVVLVLTMVWAQVSGGLNRPLFKS
jgi:hypothetical protein